MTMPAISASRKAASSVASVLKSRTGTRLTKQAAERLFMPTFSVATEKVIIPASLKAHQTRKFSSAPPHQHDEARQHFHGGVSDYWNSHPNEHHNLYKVDSEALRNFGSPPSLTSVNNKANTNKVEDGLIDLWSEHNDSHYAQPAKDFWLAHPESHL